MNNKKEVPRNPVPPYTCVEISRDPFTGSFRLIFCVETSEPTDPRLAYKLQSAVGIDVMERTPYGVLREQFRDAAIPLDFTSHDRPEVGITFRNHWDRFMAELEREKLAWRED